MSPVARRQGGAHTGRAVLVAIVGVAVALGVTFAAAAFLSQSDVEVNLGDDRFNAGSASNILEDIQERGAPLGFNDVARFQRPIWVDNTGGDPETGWIAVGAYLPDRPDCLVQWDAESDRYVAECDDAITFARSGEGLRQFPTEVVDGRLHIDLRDTAGN